MQKKSVATKKTVIFIVEGSSDKKALEKIFQGIYRHKNVVFRFTDGDITSDEKTSKENVCDVIYKKVKNYIDENKLRKTDIWQIVQIFDTDGAYIPDSAAAKGESKGFVYTPTKIFCDNVQRIIERNQKKRDLMDYLLTVNTINGIPYTAYYMSSNLDHALYDQQNLEEGLKGEFADAFYEEFIGKEELFIEYLTNWVANGVPESFPMSWKYIKEDLHSLERHTNLNLYFKQNPYL